VDTPEHTNAIRHVIAKSPTAAGKGDKATACYTETYAYLPGKLVIACSP